MTEDASALGRNVGASIEASFQVPDISFSHVLTTQSSAGDLCQAIWCDGTQGDEGLAALLGGHRHLSAGHLPHHLQVQSK